jgi:hypothetical protein
MTTPAPPICDGCVHRIPGDFARCAAFPEGIPDAIIFSEVDHREPYEGDHGIQFEPKTEADAVYARELMRED